MELYYSSKFIILNSNIYLELKSLCNKILRTMNLHLSVFQRISQILLIICISIDNKLIIDFHLIDIEIQSRFSFSKKYIRIHFFEEFFILSL